MSEFRTTFGRAARQHWRIVCAGALLGLGAGWSGVLLRQPVYESSTAVLVSPIGSAEVNLATEAELARSTETATQAVGQLGTQINTELVAVDVLANTSVLVIRYEAGTATAARAGADAFAEAYLANRSRIATAAADQRVAALTRRLNELTRRLATVNDRIGGLDVTSPELPALRGEATALALQITTLSSQANDTATTMISPGRIIQEANLPTAPVRPYRWRYLAGGAGVGVLAGIATCVGRDRLARQVRHGGDITHRTGLPLLAELPADGSYAGLLAPREPGGRTFNRLRNELIAALRKNDGVILVTSASPGSTSTIVAANLAAAFARADNEVILVGANVPDLGADALPLSQIFDVCDIPGLTDVLAGRASLSRSLQRAPRSPRLRIVTPGGTASAAGLLQSEAVRSALQVLRRQARYVIVEAPSAAAGPDAQSLAGLADVAILVAEAGFTRYDQTVDAAMQLRLVGTRLLGVVVLPRIVAAADPADLPPIPHSPRPTADVWLDPPSALDHPTTALPQIGYRGQSSLEPRPPDRGEPHVTAPPQS